METPELEHNMLCYIFKDCIVTSFSLSLLVECLNRQRTTASLPSLLICQCGAIKDSEADLTKEEYDKKGNFEMGKFTTPDQNLQTFLE